MLDLWPRQTLDSKLLWRRHRGWELKEWEILDLIISRIQLNLKKDSLVWSVNSSEYSTSQGYSVLYKTEASLGTWSLLWKQNVPPIVKLFIWKAILDALTTLSRGICESDMQMVFDSC